MKYDNCYVTDYTRSKMTLHTIILANVIAQRGILDKGLYFIPKLFSRKDLGTKVREAIDQK